MVDLDIRRKMLDLVVISNLNGKSSIADLNVLPVFLVQTANMCVSLGSSVGRRALGVGGDC